MSKCFCHFNGYEVKDAKARRDIENTNNKLNDNVSSINNKIDSNVSSVNARIETLNENIQNGLSTISNGTPLFASSIEEMTDTTRIYVNTSNGHWYYYNGTSWIDGGVYQATAINNDSIEMKMLANDVKYNLNNRININNELAIKGEITIGVEDNLSNEVVNINTGVISQDNNYVLTKNFIYNPKGCTIELDLADIDLNSLVVRTLYYDKNFNLLNHVDSYYPNQKVYGTISNNAEYVRFNFYRGTENPITINEVSKIKLLIRNIENNIVRFTIKGNLLDETKNRLGLIGNNGRLEENSGYYTSEPISLKAGKSYIIKNCRRYALYDNLYSCLEYGNTLVENKIITPGVDCYLIITYATNIIGNIVAEGTELPDSTARKKQLSDDIDLSNIIQSNSQSVLTGKKWYACGDSFTEYTNARFTEGIYNGKYKTYPYLIGLRNGMEITNLAKSGMTLATYEGSENCFTLENGAYKQIPSNADYITFKFGINDGHHSVPIGTIDDNTPNTFYGAWNVVLSYIINKCPLAKIGIIISNGLDNSTYAEATKSIAKKYGIVTLNEWDDENVPLTIRNHREDVDTAIVEARKNTFKISDDDLHPNYLCHEFESVYIENWLKNL